MIGLMNTQMLATATFLVGLSLLGISLTYPRYTDPDAAQKIENMDPGPIERHQEAIRQFYTERAKYLTPKNALCDLGLGLMSFAASGGCLLRFCGIKHLGEIRTMRTPASESRLRWLVNGGWLLLIPAAFIHYTRTMIRGDYPHFADSIAIPIFGTLVTGIVGLAIINVFWHFALGTTPLPCSLWIKPRNPELAYWTWLVLICLLMVLPCFGLYGAVIGGDFLAVPSHLLGVYLLLSARAIVASRY